MSDSQKGWLISEPFTLGHGPGSFNLILMLVFFFPLETSIIIPIVSGPFVVHAHSRIITSFQQVFKIFYSCGRKVWGHCICDPQTGQTRIFILL